MKTLVLIICLFPFFVNGQTQSFKDSASVYEKQMKVCCITFDFNKYSLRPESFVHLDTVVEALINNSNLVIKVGNHSDSRTNDNHYSSKLTQRRALAVVDYLVPKGINAKRVIGVGFGSTMPIVSEKQIVMMQTKEEMEKARQKNRRTEFRVIGLNFKE